MKREPGWYWCTVEYQSYKIPLYWTGASWKIPGFIPAIKTTWIGPKIEEPKEVLPTSLEDDLEEARRWAGGLG